MQFSVINFRSHSGIEFNTSGQLGKSDVEIIDEILAKAKADGDYLSDVVRVDVCWNGMVKHEYIVHGGQRTTHYMYVGPERRRTKMNDSRGLSDLFGKDEPVLRGAAAVGGTDYTVARISKTGARVTLLPVWADSNGHRIALNVTRRKDGAYWTGKTRAVFNAAA